MLAEVVSSTPQFQVGEVGLSVLGPVGDVVAVAVLGGEGAAGFDAAAVADAEGAAQWWGDESGAASEVEDFGFAAQ